MIKFISRSIFCILSIKIFKIPFVIACNIFSIPKILQQKQQIPISMNGFMIEFLCVGGWLKFFWSTCHVPRYLIYWRLNNQNKSLIVVLPTLSKILIQNREPHKKICIHHFRIIFHQMSLGCLQMQLRNNCFTNNKRIV